MAENKFENYVGRVKVFNTQYGEMVKISFGKQDLEKLIKWSEENNGWVNLTMSANKAGDSKVIKRDTWKPDGSKAAPAAPPQEDANEVLNQANADDSELPF
jgi:hypothetical protein